MTLEELKESGHIIFECISGSRAYGLETENSDTDIRGVYILPEEQLHSFEYTEQINNPSNDIVYYEIRKFLKLCLNNNPNIIELLAVPEDCILHKDSIFNKVKMDFFLSKRCKETFSNYAYAQIKKARGLEKKIVNPMSKVKKGVLDFCFVLDEDKSVPLNRYLQDKNIQQEDCGLVKLANMKDCYSLFHNKSIPYKGIKKSANANEVALSSIPKGEKALTLLFFNLDGYSTYCKRYKEYWAWVENRNEDRYSTTVKHGKNYDAKNIMHTFRLLKMAKEIALEGSINVRRNDREFLLSIKNGEFEYEYLLKEAEKLKEELDILFMSSNLPESPNRHEINTLLKNMRKEFYGRC